MGCVAAADWFCKRVKGFEAQEVERFTERGESYGHVIATDGCVVIDLSPYADKSKGYDT